MEKMKKRIGKGIIAAIIAVGAAGLILAGIGYKGLLEKRSASGASVSVAEITGTVNEELTKTARAAGATPVEQHGALHVSGTDLKDSHGAKFRLKGVSTHGIAWFPQYVNKDAFQTLRDNYGINTIRLAMYTNKSEGYGPGAVKKIQ